MCTVEEIYFRAAIHQLQILCTGVPDTLRPQSPMLSLCDQICTEIDTYTNEVTTSATSTPDSSQYSDTETVETPAPSVDHSPPTSSPVDARVQPLIPARASDLWNLGHLDHHRTVLSRLERRCPEYPLPHGLVIFLGGVAVGLALTTQSAVSS